MGRQNLEEDKPELAQFLSNMYLTDQELADLMVAIETSDGNAETVARNWLNENEDVIEDWIPENSEETSM